jgi:hypothetical protein
MHVSTYKVEIIIVYKCKNCIMEENEPKVTDDEFIP